MSSYLYTYVHNSTIHNRYKMETTQMFINKWMNTQNTVHTYHEISFNLKKELNSDTWYNIDKPFENIMLGDIIQILYAFTYMRHLE